ncbi:AraC family transcriptional regulator, partial [Listeria monocytogenes]|nr:AraC family transcriptional regulator [Listeria monocytogenes]
LVTDARFVGVSDASFESDEESNTALFSVRFYAWSLFLCVEPDLTGSMNRGKEPEEMFAGFVSFFQERFAEMTTNSER